jgi:hypothetical protein
MTPEIRALQDELQERLAGRGVGDQTPEDCARDWVNLRRAYGHLVEQANAWDLPLLPTLRVWPALTEDQIATLTAVTVNTGAALADFRASAQRAVEAFTQAAPALQKRRPWIARWFR